MHKDAHAREETSFQHRMQAWQHAQELEKERETQEKVALLRRSQVSPPLISFFQSKSGDRSLVYKFTSCAIFCFHFFLFCKG